MDFIVVICKNMEALVWYFLIFCSDLLSSFGLSRKNWPNHNINHILCFCWLAAFRYFYFKFGIVGGWIIEEMFGCYAKTSMFHIFIDRSIMIEGILLIDSNFLHKTTKRILITPKKKRSVLNYSNISAYQISFVDGFCACFHRK